MVAGKMGVKKEVESVVILCESAQYLGGSETIAINSALELRRRGIRVGFLTADPVIHPWLIEAGVETGIVVSIGFFGETDRKKQLVKLFGNPEVTPVVREFLRGFERDSTVVHVHNAGFNLTWKAVEAAIDMGFATVYTCHDYSSACPTSLFYNYRKKCVCPLKPLSLACWSTPCLEAGPKVRIPRLTAQMAAVRSGIYDEIRAYLYVSEMTKARLEGFHPKSAIREVLLNPLPDRPTIIARPSEFESFLYIGRMTTEKAPRDLAVAAARANLKAVFVGDGPVRESLEREFPQHRFTGWLDRKGVLEELYRCRAYVIPSLWEETFGLSVADALAHGVPVIASSTVGAKQLVEESGAGMIYPSGDIESLVSALVMLSGEAGSNMVNLAGSAPEFSWTIADQHERLLEIYSAVLTR